jgi:hypothetical protein
MMVNVLGQVLSVEVVSDPDQYFPHIFIHFCLSKICIILVVQIFLADLCMSPDDDHLQSKRVSEIKKKSR